MDDYKMKHFQEQVNHMDANELALLLEELTSKFKIVDKRRSELERIIVEGKKKKFAELWDELALSHDFCIDPHEFDDDCPHTEVNLFDMSGSKVFEILRENFL